MWNSDWVEGMSRILTAGIILAYLLLAGAMAIGFIVETEKPLGGLISLAFIGILVLRFAKVVADYICQTVADFLS
ncbi:hypothetical protein SAMN05421666_2062 [Roseovarius nanhaiticus]|uniref:Uncharacterized protein n=1 Tax=Roseovarius nanhaiticus TaxID=573024 RepID=A0A1N7GH05_9RHOB|nr:hypothetical protein [Roseovarius nanhaiticus]SEK26447.1 hypothetical protein SAMN05216208_0073 [Roseovarius nanhaiticus]SIS11796.1 hypothetical protein SAMN05421666_2062 [Roseovarius nanhaiticus]